MSLLRNGVQTRAQKQSSLKLYYANYLSKCQPRFQKAVTSYARTQSLEHMVHFFDLLGKYSSVSKGDKARGGRMDIIGPLLEANNMDSSHFAYMLSGEWQEWDNSPLEQTAMQELNELANILTNIGQYLPEKTIYDTRF